MKTMLLAVVLLALASSLFAQNCSYGQMTETGSTASCQPYAGQTPPYQPGTDVENLNTYTYADRCVYDGGGANTQYFSQSSTVTGYGQCQSLGYWPGISWSMCFAQSVPVEIDGASATDPNRMYNYAYDYYWLGKAAAGNCQPTGTFRVDLRQCSGKSCPTGGCDPQQCTCSGGSPIILDVTGNGFSLTSLANGVNFDIMASGHKLPISWTSVGGHNVFLVHDPPVVSGKQLFGNHTYPDCNNGYCALAKFAHVDPATGVIDASNPAYAKLLLWEDRNHDGIAQSDELSTLAERGVYSLSVHATPNPYVDVYGNRFELKSKVNPLGQPATDHVDRVSYDVFFVVAGAQPACIE
jgi:hypothetical protein